VSRAPRRAKKRVRRSAEEARALILDAAEKRLASGGPDGIRLQELAADLGISHPTILHHFGSREALVEAVVERALDAVQRDVLASITSDQFETEDASALLRRVMRTLGDRGHARLLAWLALSGRPDNDPAHMLRALADVMHGRRVEETGHDAPREDTLFMVVLTSYALLAEGILGPTTWDSAGLGGDAGAPERFRAWLVDLLHHHMRGAT